MPFSMKVAVHSGGSIVLQAQLLCDMHSAHFAGTCNALLLAHCIPLLPTCVPSQVGDGDCGDTLKHGAEAILAALNAGQLQLHRPAATLRQLARAVRSSMGGTSGGLYDVGLTCAATAMARYEQQERQSQAQQQQQQQGADGLQAAIAWAAALGAGVDAVERYGGASRGSRTMLDALIPAQEALQKALDAGEPDWTAL